METGAKYSTPKNAIIRASMTEIGKDGLDYY